MLACKICGSTKVNVEPRMFKNGTTHMEAKCIDCGAHNGYVSQGGDPELFIMPFGKYKGKTLGDIAKFDTAYMYWMLENVESVPIVDRCVEVLDKLELSKKR